MPGGDARRTRAAHRCPRRQHPPALSTTAAATTSSPAGRSRSSAGPPQRAYKDDYTIREWVEAPACSTSRSTASSSCYPGCGWVPAPGHTRGRQIVVETGGRPIVVGGDVAVWFGELDDPRTEGRLLVHALDPELVWLAHEHEPWQPHPV